MELQTGTLKVKRKATEGEARLFLGTLADAEDVKDWASGTEVSWAPLDENYTDPAEKKPDLAKGVALDVYGTFGFQECLPGHWLVRDEHGVTVYKSEELSTHFVVLGQPGAQNA